MSESRAKSIFESYSNALKGFIRKRISSAEESEDMLHDLFYRFIVCDGEQQAIENVSSWLYRVANNLIIDRSRKKREQPMPYISVGDDEGEIPLGELMLIDENSAEENMMRSLICDELHAALATLPLEQRSVFELNELQGVSFSEISDATGIAVNTLISRKRYAVIALRRKLGYLLAEFTDNR